MPVPVRRLLVIEDAVLLSMAQNSSFVSEFPFLANVRSQAVSSAVKRPGCGSCGQRARERVSAYSQAKASLASMSTEKKKRLKELLNAERVRIRYVDSSRRTIERTF